MQADVPRTAALRTGLEELGDALEAAAFHLPGAKAHETERRDLIRTVREYLLPRLRDPDAPVVAAVVGPSGVGKSSLLNALAGRDVSPAGPVRPTTKNAVLWAHREHAGRYWSEFVARVRDRAGPQLDVVVGDDPLTKNLTIIDTPPLDYAEDDGHLVAAEVVSVVDMCIVVASPARYADAATWDFIRRIHRRGLPMLFVLNRTTDLERTEVRTDWARRLAEAGMLLDPSPSSVFTIAERSLDPTATAVESIRKELGELADPEMRDRLAGQSAAAAVRGLLVRSNELADALEADGDFATRLRNHVEKAYRSHSDEIIDGLRDGDLARLAAQGDWPSASLDITGIVTRRAGLAAQQAATAWLDEPNGEAALQMLGQGLWRHGQDTPIQAQHAMDDYIVEVHKVIDVHAKRARMGKRARRKAADQLWQAALVATAEPSSGLVRRFGNRAAQAMEQSKTALADSIRSAMESDATRFTDPLGDSLDAASAAGRIRSRARFVSHQIEDRAGVPFSTQSADHEVTAADGSSDEGDEESVVTPDDSQQAAGGDGISATEPVDDVEPALPEEAADRDSEPPHDTEWVAYEGEGV